MYLKYLISLCVFFLSLENVFAQNNERFQIGFRISPNISNLYERASLTFYDTWSSSLILGAYVEGQVLKNIALTSGLEYIIQTEVGKRAIPRKIELQDTTFDFTNVIAKLRLGYISVPLDLKIVMVDGYNINLYGRIGVRGMYNVYALETFKFEREQTKQSIKDTELVNKWVWGRCIGLGVEIEVNPTTTLFIEPTVEYFAKTTQVKISNNIGELILKERSSFSVGIAVGTKF